MIEDINALARQIYEGNEQEKITKRKRISLTGDTSDYHNSSPRGKEGLSGEDAACEYLQAKGYKIIKRNFRCYSGEIDIIAAKGNVIAFIEVKTRSNTHYGLPREAVTNSKQKKIRRVAETYLMLTKRITNPPPLSFDVIEVIRSGGEVKSLNHLVSCF